MEHQSDHIYYALLKQVHIFAALFTSLSKLSQYAGEKTFSGANRHMLTLLHSILICRVTY
jgi:hypothetical protein